MHRATKLVPQIRHLTYLKRLNNLGLQIVDDKILRGDLIFKKLEWLMKIKSTARY